jgi:hypothetical protein
VLPVDHQVDRLAAGGVAKDEDVVGSYDERAPQARIGPLLARL